MDQAEAESDRPAMAETTSEEVLDRDIDDAQRDQTLDES